MHRLLAICIALGVATPAWADLKFRPKEGNICDTWSGFCADHMGVSMGVTKLYLGDKAEQKLMAEIQKVGSENFNPTVFNMRGGLTCDTTERKCWTDRSRDKLHEKATQTLFGKQHASQKPP